MNPKLLLLTLFIACIANTLVAQNKVRLVEELTKDTSGWEVVKDAMYIARNKFEILSRNPDSAKTAIY